MSSPWYQDGLRFDCTRCGHCCTGVPGMVRLSEAEADRIARYLGLDLQDFLERCTRRLGDGALGLVEKTNLDCVFWSPQHGCAVHPVRPRQCATWPFWRANLASPQHWAAAARSCPGMDNGPVHDASSIAAQANDDGTSGEVPGVGSA